MNTKFIKRLGIPVDLDSIYDMQLSLDGVCDISTSGDADPSLIEADLLAFREEAPIRYSAFVNVLGDEELKISNEDAPEIEEYFDMDWLTVTIRDSQSNVETRNFNDYLAELRRVNDL